MNLILDMIQSKQCHLQSKVVCCGCNFKIKHKHLTQIPNNDCLFIKKKILTINQCS